MRPLSRRDSLRLALGSAAGLALPLAAHPFFTTPGLFAEEVEKRFRTPSQTEGPFYPDNLPLDTDNDLLVVNDALTPAVGTITHLSGRILDSRGEPLRNHVIEIWQCDANGAYLHTKSGNADQRDSSFQGFGRFLTSSTGEYYFRTIKPVPYPGRAPHIHVKVKKGDRELLTTQFYIDGDERNERDGIFRGLRSDEAKKSLSAEFKPLPDSNIGELAARIDVVLGATPAS
jgi:protocatechuate 3,4-dioxygenase beta subunit